MTKFSFDKILLYLTFGISIFLLGHMLTSNMGHKKAVFIDIGKLVENYKLKKDLEAAAGKDLYSIKNGTDSIKMVRKMVQGPEAAHLDTVLYRREYATKQYYEQSNQEISKKIWERLNPVIEQYGKEKGYDLVIGANGAGTVLYGSQQCDVTEDIIKYANSKYEKGS